MKHLILTVLISSSLISCAKSGQEFKSTEIDVTLVNPNGYTEDQIRADWGIPQWPEATHADYDTVKGVDDAGLVGVRDDWEIMNAIASYPDVKEFNLLNNAAKLNNQMIDAYEENDKDKMVKVFDDIVLTATCYSDNFDVRNEYLIYQPKKDTEKRKDNHEKWNKVVDYYYGPIKIPSYDKLQKECPNLM